MQVAESEAGSNSASLSAKRASVANRSVHVRHAGWDFVDAVRKHPLFQNWRLGLRAESPWSPKAS